MSDALSLAVYRAKMARKTPSVINVVKFEDGAAEIANLKKQLDAAHDYSERVMTNLRSFQSENARLAGELHNIRKELSYSKRLVGIYNQNMAVGGVVPPLFSEILAAVSHSFYVGAGEIKSSRRTAEYALPRQVTMYLCKKLTPHTVSAIGRFFKRDRATVLHSLEKIRVLRESDAALDNQISLLEQKFRPQEQPCTAA